MSIKYPVTSRKSLFECNRVYENIDIARTI